MCVFVEVSAAEENVRKEDKREVWKSGRNVRECKIGDRNPLLQKRNTEEKRM